MATGDAYERPESSPDRLVRVVGLPGAVLLGLGSILGTGVFVSLGIAAGAAGPAVVLAVVLAAGVATCNGLSSAQLAASHPVSGGTYEYGYRYLSPALGFLAGWTFVCAKTASAATAALGIAGYVMSAIGAGDARSRVGLGLAVVLATTLLVAGGMRRSSRANTIVVSLTLLGLLAFVACGLPAAVSTGSAHFAPFLAEGPGGLLRATALLFVAYTGYGRIATLGEEVRDPRRTIPRAIVLTLVASLLLYLAVAIVAVGTAGAPALATAARGSAAPLEAIAAGLGVPGLRWLVAVAAVTAMAGVLLNLLLGISRVLLAMSRRGDVPRGLAVLDRRGGSPRRAVLATGALIGALVLVGDVGVTWSFSAFTVLVYYAVTNLAALRLPAGARLYPRAVAALGLAACVALAFWVEVAVWVAGLGVLGAGLVWHRVARRVAAVSGGNARGAG